MRPLVAAVLACLLASPTLAQQDGSLPPGPLDPEQIHVAPVPGSQPGAPDEAPAAAVMAQAPDPLTAGHMRPMGVDPSPVTTGPLPVVLRPVTPETTDAPDGGEPGATDEGQDTAAAEPERFKRVPADRITTGPIFEASSVPINMDDTVLYAGARLRELDKMTGKRQTFDLAVGQEWEDSRMLLSLDACRAPPDGEQHGTMAFLRIWDKRHPDAPAVFSGWMFAESPALSALDHPRYDFWVISCTTSAGVASAKE